MRWKNTKTPLQNFVRHVLRLLLMLPGRVTFRNLRRYNPDHEKTCARWFARDGDFVSLNRATFQLGKDKAQYLPVSVVENDTERLSPLV
jgi:hypothetical protein